MSFIIIFGTLPFAIGPVLLLITRLDSLCCASASDSRCLFVCRCQDTIKLHNQLIIWLLLRDTDPRPLPPPHLPITTLQSVCAAQILSVCARLRSERRRKITRTTGGVKTSNSASTGSNNAVCRRRRSQLLLLLLLATSTSCSYGRRCPACMRMRSRDWRDVTSSRLGDIRGCPTTDVT